MEADSGAVFSVSAAMLTSAVDPHAQSGSDVWEALSVTTRFLLESPGPWGGFCQWPGQKTKKLSVVYSVKVTKGLLLKCRQ